MEDLADPALSERAFVLCGYMEEYQRLALTTNTREGGHSWNRLPKDLVRVCRCRSIASRAWWHLSMPRGLVRVVVFFSNSS